MTNIKYSDLNLEGIIEAGNKQQQANDRVLRQSVNSSQSLRNHSEYLHRVSHPSLVRHRFDIGAESLQIGDQGDDLPITGRTYLCFSQTSFNLRGLSIKIGLGLGLVALGVRYAESAQGRDFVP